jgi:hypothetical protein
MMCIAQHHRNRFPAAQFFDRIDIDPRLDKPDRKGMPEVMEAEPRDPHLAHRRLIPPAMCPGRHSSALMIVSVRRVRSTWAPVQRQDFPPSHPHMEREEDDLMEPGTEAASNWCSSSAVDQLSMPLRTFPLAIFNTGLSSPTPTPSWQACRHGLSSRARR